MERTLTALEADLLRHLVTGCDTHADGRPMAWGAWMTECVESLCGMGYARLEVDRESGVAGYFATDAGRAALSIEKETVK